MENFKERLEIAKENLKEAKSNCNKVFQYEEELQAKINRQMVLNQMLEIDKKDEVLADEDMETEIKNLANTANEFRNYQAEQNEDYELEP